MASFEKISFLVVAYNAVAHIQSCIESIITEIPGGVSYEILLVDNGDGSTQTLVEQIFPEVMIVPAVGNVGYGAGNNLLARHATGDVLVIINPDARLDHGALEALTAACIDSPATAAFAGIFRTPEGQLAPENEILRPGVLHTLALAIGIGRLRRKFAPFRDHIRPIPTASGACFAIRRKWFEKLGGFDPRFFLYFEETDLFRRLESGGGQLVLLPGFRIIHDTGSGQRHSVARRQSYLRGYMTYCSKHFGPIRTFLCGTAMWLFALRVTLAENGWREIGEVMPRHWWRGWDGRHLHHK